MSFKSAIYNNAANTELTNKYLVVLSKEFLFLLSCLYIGRRSRTVAS